MAKGKEGIGLVVTEKNRRGNNFDWNKMLVAHSLNSLEFGGYSTVFSQCTSQYFYF